MITPTNDRQTSERERLAQYCELEARAFSAMEYLGEKRNSIAEKFTSLAAQLRADETEIAHLNRLVESRSNEAADSLYHALRLCSALTSLRADNEALRTVTDRNVHDALNAYDDATGEGWQLPCAQGMRAAIQSFIRSKESRRG